ncbi:MAG: energy-coupling factor ABC transporter ATP-binding protein [Coriobacteriales bacterium]|jgi:cobalt/nickel transport system ATP-binding protein|nr:energy-coupling factor ABC transporter ATP-binding protein [Coriobacteriales bacterium]
MTEPKEQSELFRVEGISYRYDDRYLALNDVSLSFRAGEMVAILGSNGAGKSTFFLCCNGVLRPQSGTIFLHGQEVSKSKKDITRQRQAVGLVFQDPDSQIIAGSVESEISFGPLNLGLSNQEVEQRVEESLEQMDIVRYRDYAPQYLSGGEKKRVSIADIFAMHSEMILLDEPTASLDPKNAEALERILIGLSQVGIAIVISTHDVDFAYRVAERVVVFAEGQVIADASADQVFASAEVLSRAGLKQPLLFAAWQILVRENPSLSSKPWPRTIEQFELLAASVNSRAAG